MLVADAQREVRTTYRRGVIGQAVAGAVWLASAILASWGSPRAATLTLVVGGFFIFPLTTLMLRFMGGPASLSAGNPFRLLAMQIAFVLPLSMPLVAPVVAYKVTWFYPAMMVLVGAHYLPFVTLYGMRAFGVLAALLVTLGMATAFAASTNFAIGGWLGSAALLGFAAFARAYEE